MNATVPKFAELAAGEVNLLVPPRIVAMMTGVQRATQDATGAITLLYDDFTQETARFAMPPEMAEMENFFSVVSLVQSQRSAS
jgi:hypothetical protein